MSINFTDLKIVNVNVNHSVTYKTDLANYGKQEKWAYPKKGYGDCEDYALLKLITLYHAGWDIKNLNIGICKDQSGTGHAILFATYGNTDYVLDNQTDEVKPWNLVPYHWIEKTVNGSFNHWKEIT